MKFQRKYNTLAYLLSTYLGGFKKAFSAHFRRRTGNFIDEKPIFLEVSKERAFFSLENSFQVRAMADYDKDRQNKARGDQNP